MEQFSDPGNEHPASLPLQEVERTLSQARQRLDWLAAILWPFVFALNLIVPLKWGLEFAEGGSLAGMWLAIWLVLLSGWWLCIKASAIVRRVLLGAVLTALSQIYPIIHFFLGALGMALLSSLTQFVIQFENAILDSIWRHISIFMLTVFVAAGLLVAALGLGAILGLFLPKKWLNQSNSAGNLATLSRIVTKQPEHEV